MKTITSVILVKKIARSCSTFGNSIEIGSSPNSRNSIRTGQAHGTSRTIPCCDGCSFSGS